jgi:hypothetical protein
MRMVVPVVQVGIVGMTVNDWRVPMHVAMRLARWIVPTIMGVLMMLIVHVSVVVLNRLMRPSSSLSRPST